MMWDRDELRCLISSHKQGTDESLCGPHRECGRPLLRLREDTECGTPTGLTVGGDHEEEVGEYLDRPGVLCRGLGFLTISGARGILKKQNTIDASGVTAYWDCSYSLLAG